MQISEYSILIQICRVLLNVQRQYSTFPTKTSQIFKLIVSKCNTSLEQQDPPSKPTQKSDKTCCHAANTYITLKHSKIICTYDTNHAMLFSFCLIKSRRDFRSIKGLQGLW